MERSLIVDNATIVDK
jgi:isocitrate dehydrogenase